jgi:hypothetical protein
MALEPIGASLGSDGYSLVVEAATAERLEVRIDAGPDACADCLVPVEVLAMIISGQVAGAYSADDITIAMPSTTTSSASH